MRTIRVGTRGSNLALWQANYVLETLKKHFPETSFERIIIKTEGDQDQKSSLTQIGGQGVFTKEIENALLSNKIDIAVHSLKDLPSKMPDGLILGAVPERGPVEDVLVTHKGISLDQLPQGAKVATGSIRRRSQLLKIRPDLQITDLRGNIDTRLKKLKSQNLDAIIMAKAAIIRLDLDNVKYQDFNPEDMIPGVGQGAVGIQVREDDEEVVIIVNSMKHEPTFQAVIAERALLNTLDSGCQFPIGGYATVNNDQLHISGFVGDENGTYTIVDHYQADPKEAEMAGKSLALKLIDRGALTLLEAFKNK